MDRKDIAQPLEEHGLRTIQFWLIDLFGRPRVTHVPASGLDRILASGAPLDGSSVAGMSRVDRSDLAAMPDLDSFRIVPGTAGMPAAAILFCDVYRPDGTGQALDANFRVGSRGSRTRQASTPAASRSSQRREIPPDRKTRIRGEKMRSRQAASTGTPRPSRPKA